MNYDATAEVPKGEVIVCGPQVMKGYFRDQEKTNEVIIDGKWFSTGDIGVINPNGSLSIIDRIKNLFKLSQGEYIAPEKLESEYVKSPWLQQVWVHGDSLHDYLLLIGVIDKDYLKSQN